MAEAHAEARAGRVPAFAGYSAEEEKLLKTFAQHQLQKLAEHHRAFICKELRSLSWGKKEAQPTMVQPTMVQPTVQPTVQPMVEENWEDDDWVPPE